MRTEALIVHSVSLAFQPDGKLLMGSSLQAVRFVMSSTPTFVVNHGTQLSVYGINGADQISIDTVTLEGVLYIRVTEDGASESFFPQGAVSPLPTTRQGVENIRIIWPGHGVLRHLRPPLAGVAQQLIPQKLSG